MHALTAFYIISSLSTALLAEQFISLNTRP